MVALGVVILDEGLDLAFEIAGQKVMLKQDTVLDSPVPSLDLALDLWVLWRASDMIDVVFVEVKGSSARRASSIRRERRSRSAWSHT